jgi:hypothetical protein
MPRPSPQRRRRSPKPGSEKVIPLGEPLDWSEDDIARMAEVTEEDKVSALAFWQANASPAFKDLPQARKRKKQ